MTELDELVRDLTKSVPLAKSEVRQRIQALIDKRINEAQIIKPGEVIPVETFKGQDYIALSWLQARISAQSDKHSSKEDI